MKARIILTLIAILLLVPCGYSQMQKSGDKTYPGTEGYSVTLWTKSLEPSSDMDLTFFVSRASYPLNESFKSLEFYFSVSSLNGLVDKWIYDPQEGFLEYRGDTLGVLTPQNPKLELPNGVKAEFFKDKQGNYDYSRAWIFIPKKVIQAFITKAQGDPKYNINFSEDFQLMLSCRAKGKEKVEGGSGSLKPEKTEDRKIDRFICRRLIEVK